MPPRKNTVRKREYAAKKDRARAAWGATGRRRLLYPRLVLDVRELGPLLVDAPAQPGRLAHVSAASGLVRCGELLYVVADDEAALAVFGVGDPSGGRFEAFANDELPLGTKERKAVKPDLEALADVGGALLAIGSGATDRRDRGWLWQLDGCELAGAPREISLLPLFAELRRQLDELNIEGLAIDRDRMWLAQRGNGKDGANEMIELDLEAAVAGLDRGELPADALRGTTAYDLGEIEGVRLTFTDLAPAGNGRLLFSAAAEAGDSTYHDGAVVGAAVGLFDPAAGEIVEQWPLPEPLKVEGIATAADGSLLLVTDADDAARPASLLRASLPR